MFERLNTPDETLNFKLGATLKMEQKVLDILGGAIDHAQDEKVRLLMRQHRAESEQHVVTVEEAFASLGWDVDDSPCPAIEGLEKESSTTIKKTNDALVDSVILQAGLEVEHHEIGVYENLIINASASDRDEVVRILNRNLESEQSALEKVRALQAQIAATALKSA